MSAAAAKRLAKVASGEWVYIDDAKLRRELGAMLEERERLLDERKRLSIEVCAEMVSLGFDDSDAAVMRDFVRSVLAPRKAPKGKR